MSDTAQQVGAVRLWVLGAVVVGGLVGATVFGGHDHPPQEVAYDHATIAGPVTVGTDDGPEITVDRLEVSVLELTLVDCPHDHGWWERLTGLFAASAAHAGHGSEDDPARIVGPWRVEVVRDDPAASGRDTTTVSLKRGRLVEPSFCTAHLAWAADYPAAIEDDEMTLVVEGTVLGPGDEATPFSMHTQLPWGSTVPLVVDGREVSTFDPDTAVDASVHLEVDELFTGISPQALSRWTGSSPGDDDLARALLRNLADNTEVRLRPLTR